MRDQPGLHQAGIEIGHWDNVVRRRRSREVSNLKTENLSPAKRLTLRKRHHPSRRPFFVICGRTMSHFRLFPGNKTFQALHMKLGETRNDRQYYRLLF